MGGGLSASHLFLTASSDPSQVFALEWFKNTTGSTKSRIAILSFWGLAKEGRFYERNKHFFGSSDCAFRYLAAPADAPAETTDRRVRITTDAPVLRIDHISAKGKLLGVWPFSYARNQKHEDEGDVDVSCRENSHRLVVGFRERQTSI